MINKNSLGYKLNVNTEKSYNKLGKTLNNVGFAKDAETPVSDIEDIPPVKTQSEIDDASETANWSQVVDDDGKKPEDNADVTDTTNVKEAGYGISSMAYIYTAELSGSTSYNISEATINSAIGLDTDQYVYETVIIEFWYDDSGRWIYVDKSDFTLATQTINGVSTILDTVNVSSLISGYTYKINIICKGIYAP